MQLSGGGRVNKKLHSNITGGNWKYAAVLVLFSALTFLIGYHYSAFILIWLAAGEAAAALVLLISDLLRKKNSKKILEDYISSIASSSETARDQTLLSFPLPIGVFRLNDSSIVWGNEMFFEMCGPEASRFDIRMNEIVPEVHCDWITEGKRQFPSLLQVNGRKYHVHGNAISAKDSGKEPVLAITYWVDVTEYDDTRIEFEQTRPVAAVIVIDNLEEMYRNLNDRAKNDIRDSIEDKLFAWASSCKGFVRRYDRDRYVALFEKRNLEKMKAERFPIIENMHEIENSGGINASISLGIGEDADSLEEAFQFADLAIELALTRGGDQAVIKNKLNFDFYGGRGLEVEKRTKVRSRVMANTISELIRDSSRVLIMGHRFADFDCIGAAIGISCIVRKYGIKSHIIIDENNNASKPLVAMMRENAEYRDTFISVHEAMAYVDGRALLVIVDTNRPEQLENEKILSAFSRVAVIDHHRVSSTYVKNAVIGYIEPYASSTCELVSEMIQELADKNDILECEAEALLAGIVLDTKNFTLRTGDRTFEAAAFLRRSGADTTNVKKLLQTNMNDALERYRIMQSAELYRGVAIAAPENAQNRIVAAQAADELLNISGVDASIVVAPGDDGTVFASARSIGDLNVQIICEKLGGGGNRSAAAVKFPDSVDIAAAVELVHQAIDDYLE